MTCTAARCVSNTPEADRLSALVGTDGFGRLTLTKAADMIEHLRDVIRDLTAPQTAANCRTKDGCD